MLAVRNTTEQIIRNLISKGADVNAVEDDLWTCLHIAAGEYIDIKNDAIPI